MGQNHDFQAIWVYSYTYIHVCPFHFWQHHLITFIRFLHSYDGFYWDAFIQALYQNPSPTVSDLWVYFGRHPGISSINLIPANLIHYSIVVATFSTILAALPDLYLPACAEYDFPCDRAQGLSWKNPHCFLFCSQFLRTAHHTKFCLFFVRKIFKKSHSMFEIGFHLTLFCAIVWFSRFFGTKSSSGNSPEKVFSVDLPIMNHSWIESGQHEQ